MNTLDRRTFVRRTGLTGLSLLAGGLTPQRTVADPDPPSNANTTLPAPSNPIAPEIHAFRIGTLEVFVIHDGAISMNSIQPSFAPEASRSEIEELLQKNFLPPGHVTLSMNVLVVRGKSGVVLFDAGAGRAFGTAGGRLLNGLTKLGIGPSDVKTIFITHAHPDHIGGLVDDSNQPVFGSAQLVATKPEVEFWTGESPDLSGMRTPVETKTQTVATIKKMLGGVKTSLELKGPGRLSPEVELVSAPGHTPGHCVFSVTQGDQKLLVIGDSVHLHALQFPHPEWTMAYDVTPAQAVATRLKLFKDAAAARTLLLSYHLPFPGLGHARVAGRGYEWVPRPWVV